MKAVLPLLAECRLLDVTEEELMGDDRSQELPVLQDSRLDMILIVRGVILIIPIIDWAPRCPGGNHSLVTGGWQD